MSIRLVALWYSPWSLAARWALEHHRIDYRYTEYLPMMGELWLRMRTGRWRGGKVSVPALLVGKNAGGSAGPLVDSLAIARYAEAHGSGPTLFPDGADGDITAWNQRAQTLLACGRILTTRLIAERPAALRESTPKSLRKLPGSLALARRAARFIAGKYPIDKPDDAILDDMRACLRAYREALTGRDYLIGDGLSYADMIAGVSLQVVCPQAHEFLPMGQATRASWTRPQLAEEFSDLLTWRDQLFERHYWQRPGA